MKGHGLYSTTALLNTATAVVRQNNYARMRRSVMCWVCQKDVPSNEGKASFMLPKVGQKLTVGSAPRKFICFKCKPKETT